jgi:hypothetical protein
MKKDTIIQYVGFVTNLEADAFVPEWESYAKKLTAGKIESPLLQLSPATKSRFRYLSQHEWPGSDFHFNFMNERKSEYFSQHHVKVVHAGGYMLLSSEKKAARQKADVRIVSFAGHNEVDMDFYRGLEGYQQLDIYQAYYESCHYGHILEFFVPNANVTALLAQLKERLGVETGVYQKCRLAHAAA